MVLTVRERWVRLVTVCGISDTTAFPRNIRAEVFSCRACCGNGCGCAGPITLTGASFAVSGRPFRPAAFHPMRQVRFASSVIWFWRTPRISPSLVVSSRFDDAPAWSSRSRQVAMQISLVFCSLNGEADSRHHSVIECIKCFLCIGFASHYHVTKPSGTMGKPRCVQSKGSKCSRNS